MTGLLIVPYRGLKKAFLVSRSMFSLKTFTVGSFAVPFRIQYPKKIVKR